MSGGKINQIAKITSPINRKIMVVINFLKMDNFFFESPFQK